MGIPAEIIVASCLVAGTRSFGLTLPPLPFLPISMRKKEDRVVLRLDFRLEVIAITVSPLRRNSATASVSVWASILPLMALPC